MPWDINVGQDYSFPCDADAVIQFRFVVLGSDGFIDAAAGAVGEAVLGVLQNDPSSGQTAAVRTAGCTAVVAGAAINAGALVASDSVGRAVTYTKATVFTGTPYIVSGSDVLGIALEAAAGAGSQVGVMYQPRGFHS